MVFMNRKYMTLPRLQWVRRSLILSIIVDLTQHTHAKIHTHTRARTNVLMNTYTCSFICAMFSSLWRSYSDNCPEELDSAFHILVLPKKTNWITDVRNSSSTAVWRSRWGARASWWQDKIQNPRSHEVSGGRDVDSTKWRRGRKCSLLW